MKRLFANIFALLFGVLTTGCATKAKIQTFEIAFEEAFSNQEFAYDPEANSLNEEYRNEISEDGFLVVYFFSNMDLVKIAQKKEMHHLGYNSYSCLSDPEDFLTEEEMGTVFNVEREELQKLGKFHETKKGYFYKIYIPANLKSFRRISSDEEVNYSLFQEEIKKDGLCYKIYAGNMLGFYLTSNLEKIPQTELFQSLFFSE